MLSALTGIPLEISLKTFESYKDIFNEVEVDAVFKSRKGGQWTVPAFWAGDNTFRFRFSPPEPGDYTYKTFCSNKKDGGLHGREGSIEVKSYTGKNKLYKKGRLRISDNKRFFEHADGTAFFWLADTWWMGLCKRLIWPGEFQLLTEDRVRKGFSVIQIVAGLYPDMPPFDERGANEAGYPWEPEFDRINPTYFNMADLRLNWLIENELVPCIVACWGYFLPLLGPEKMKKHWRYLIARYAAYPVFWCLAGEGIMPYYLSETKDDDSVSQKTGWTEMARYVHSLDPYGNPITIHPGGAARDTVDDPKVLDFEMLQTGHDGMRSIPNTVNLITEAFAREPRMPVLNSEVSYEGIGEASRQEAQRFMFWSCVLSGACGHTYGANGLWQLNQPGKPFGPSPHGMSWGNVTWQEASQLPGSTHLGVARRLLERYEWWRFEPHPEWISPGWTKDNYLGGYAAGIPEQVRIIFLPAFKPLQDDIVVQSIESDVSYKAFLFSPINGEEYDYGIVKPDTEGNWHFADPLPIYQDWVLVLDR